MAELCDDWKRQQRTPTRLPSLLRLLPASGELTECLLVHYEAAHDALVAASQGEAVPSEHDVEGLCGMQTKREIRRMHCICLELPAAPVGNCRQ